VEEGNAWSDAVQSAVALLGEDTGAVPNVRPPGSIPSAPDARQGETMDARGRRTVARPEHVTRSTESERSPGGESPSLPAGDASSDGIEYEAIFAALPDDAPRDAGGPGRFGPEVDLASERDVLVTDRAAHVVPAVGSVEAGRPPPAAPPDLESLFRRLRQESLGSGVGSAGRALAAAETLIGAGMTAEARPLIEAAARDPGCRSRAYRLLARLLRADGSDVEAVSWLERAAGAPATGGDDRLSTLRELAPLLEATGEPARALAAWIEAGTLAPGDPEVESHIARLSAPDRDGGDPSTR
jgi:hypothetical protein